MIVVSVIRELIERYKKYKDPVSYYRNKGVVIGENCEIRSAKFSSEPYLIKIGNHVRINAGVELVTHDGGAWVLRECANIDNRKNITLFGPIIIGNNVHIGSNAILMPNIRIGNNCIIGCGAIVTHDIPDNSIAVGIPAKVIETIDEYERKHVDNFCFTKEMDASQLEEFLREKYKDIME